MKNFLFDFDGTLVDSMPNYTKCAMRILDDYGISYGDDLMKIITPLGLGGTAEYFVSLGVPLSKEATMELIMEYLKDGYLYFIPAKPHVEEALRKLRSHGIHLHVLTASPHTNLDPCIKRLGLFDLFDNVWSCDDFGTTKADPKIYSMVAERIGAPVDEILFLDDNLHADVVAKQAGMRICGVYDPSSEDFVQQMKAETDYFIYSFAHLPELFVDKEEIT